MTAPMTRQQIHAALLRIKEGRDSRECADDISAVLAEFDRLVLAERARDQLRVAGDALVEAWDDDPIGRIDGEIVEPFRRNAPAAEVPR